MRPIDTTETALLVVDAQRGFTQLHPEQLPVPGGQQIVDAINLLLEIPWRRIDASQDWHPSHHRSFHGRQDNLYPPHCVMNTPGAEFLPNLNTHLFHTIWRKGFHPDVEAYAITAQHPGYPELLKAEKINTVIVCGLATNICCFYSARDLRRHGFRVLIVEDASAGIDVPAANLHQSKAKEEGKEMGIEYVMLEELLQAVHKR